MLLRINKEDSRLSMEVKVLWIVLLVLAVSTQTGIAGGLLGRPVFCIGDDAVAMTLEFSQMHYATDNIIRGDGIGTEKIETQRGMLRATFGLTQSIDADLAIGTANLNFPEAPEGYSVYESNWDLAWGGGIRFGYPSTNTPWQLQFGASYLGFQAEGEVTNDTKVLFTRYAWQEFTPTLSVGYRFGQFIAYVGAIQAILFGTRETTVEYLGTERPGAGGKAEYTDAKQRPQGLFGVEWLFPDGYHLTTQISTGGEGRWGFSIGIAQALK